MRRPLAFGRSPFARLLSAVGVTLLCGALAAAPVTPLTPAQEARAAAIQKNLRCPLCDTGESISESGSDISVKMRSSVREQVAVGRTDADIYAYFAQRYGNFVLLDPPKQGRNLLLWGAPLAALVAGGAVLAGLLKRKPDAGNPAAPTPEEPFDPFLAQVQRDTRRGGPDVGGGP